VDFQPVVEQANSGGAEAALLAEVQQISNERMELIRDLLLALGM